MPYLIIMHHSIIPGATTHNLHLSGVFVGNKQVLVRAQLQLDPQAGMVLKVRTEGDWIGFGWMVSSLFFSSLFFFSLSLALCVYRIAHCVCGCVFCTCVVCIYTYHHPPPFQIAVRSEYVDLSQMVADCIR